MGFNFVCPIGTVTSRTPGSEIRLSALSELLDTILARYPSIRFIRIVPDFARVIRGDRFAAERSMLGRLLDQSPKVFVDGFSDDDFQKPAPSGCFIGGFKPFLASSPDYDNAGVVYICCCYSHFTNKRYAWKYVLCRVNDIVEHWNIMQERMAKTGVPYGIAGESQTDWTAQCALCLHSSSNRLLQGANLWR